MNTSHIRPSKPNDLDCIKKIIDAVDLFPSEFLDGMFLSGGNDAEQSEFWITFDDGSPVAVAYCAPEAMTSGTWNLLLIAVHPERQSEGIGAEMMSYVESKLASIGTRLLLVETSGTDAFARTRAFYKKLNYEEEARIREFYSAGDDKIVFRKAL